MDVCVGNRNLSSEASPDVFQDLVWYFLPSVVLVPPLGLPANVLVVRLLLGKPGICSTSEIITLHLAVFDLLFCVMVVVEYILMLYRQTVEAADFVAWGMTQGGGPLLLTFLAFDSYMAVCHPLIFLRLKDPKVRLSACSLATVITAAYCCMVTVPVLLMWNLIVVLIISILVISACNILILRSLRQTGPNKKEVHSVKRRAFKIVLTSFVLVVAHYLPPITEYVLQFLDPYHFLPLSPFTSVSDVFVSTGSITHPLCYLIRTKQLPRLRCF